MHTPHPVRGFLWLLQPHHIPRVIPTQMTLDILDNPVSEMISSYQ